MSSKNHSINEISLINVTTTTTMTTCVDPPGAVGV
ncbi:hypothetical protein Amico_0492 [Aminobacterium colombiense DSM 12261]|uniref:Uncharacterized protein n=1 Tax=Aminobacterium colombiense (strain DSM 12261 / ALA-1) TaxID=572547 RepID=D5EDJ9_AMICL|nr:hypothetical protein Amico_0492 [Aminobacterium colombiense DSM 12261]